MSTAKKRALIGVEDYLAGELRSPVKNEYVGGFVYAMAGARNVHNLIASNTLAYLHHRLRDSSCVPYNSDTKIRVRYATHDRFYYPDVSVICRPNAPSDSYQDEPSAIVEVLFPSTRRIDEGEKKDAYLTIPSLAVYILIEQEMAAIAMFRRTDTGFVREEYEGLNAELPLPELGIVLPLAEVYRRVTFAPISEDDSEETVV